MGAVGEVGLGSDVSPNHLTRDSVSGLMNDPGRPTHPFSSSGAQGELRAAVGSARTPDCDFIRK